MRFIISFMLFVAVSAVSSCGTQNMPTGAENKFNFSEITFHTSVCFGSCPQISLHINANREIEVKRQFYKGKVEKDTTGSGNFKGVLSEGDYNQLLAHLQKIDWETIEFPSVMCCDAPVRTIVLAYAGKKKTYRSMTPPESSRELIQFLTKLGSSRDLPHYSGELNFEGVVE